MAEFGTMIGDGARRRSTTDLDRRLARLERGGSPVSQAPSGVATSPFPGLESRIADLERRVQALERPPPPREQEQTRPTQTRGDQT
jgi:hypothetical protein